MQSSEGFDINRTAASQPSEVHLGFNLSLIRKLSQLFELSVFEMSFDLEASGENAGFPLAQTMDSDEDQHPAEAFDKFLARMTNGLCDKDEGKEYDVSKCENRKPNEIWFDSIISSEMSTVTEDVAAMFDRYNVNNASECNESSVDVALPACKRCKVVFDTGGNSIDYRLDHFEM